MMYPPEEPQNNAIINSDVGTDKRLFRKPVDSSNQENINSVIKNGCVIIKNLFTDTEVEQACQELKYIAESPAAGPASSGGRNKFEGFQTNRIYALLNKSRIFDKFVTHPQVVALNDYFLDPGWLLSVMLSIYIQPGEDPQTLHHDDGYITVPRPHRPFGTVSVCPVRMPCTWTDVFSYRLSWLHLMHILKIMVQLLSCQSLTSGDPIVFQRVLKLSLL